MKIYDMKIYVKKTKAIARTPHALQLTTEENNIQVKDLLIWVKQNGG